MIQHAINHHQVFDESLSPLEFSLSKLFVKRRSTVSEMLNISKIEKLLVKVGFDWLRSYFDLICERRKKPSFSINLSRWFTYEWLLLAEPAMSNLFLANLPSKGLMVNLPEIGSNLRLNNMSENHVQTNDASNAEVQIITTDKTNILARSLQLRRLRHFSTSPELNSRSNSKQKRRW